MAVALACLCAGTDAATFVVTRQDDPIPDGCKPDDCSLREAVAAANANDPLVGRDVVELAEATYTLTAGVMQLEQDLQIQGKGSAKTQIATDDVLFHSAGGVYGLSIYIYGVTIQSNGSVNFGSIELNDVVVPVGSGSFVAEDTTDHATSVLVRNSVLQGLHCSHGVGNCIIADSEVASLEIGGPDPGPAVILLRMTMDGSATDASSGISIGSASWITIEDSTIANTLGGMYSYGSHVPGPVLLHNVSYRGNKGPIRFSSAAVVSIADSEFRDNAITKESSPLDSPAAIWATEGSDWTISGTTFVGNLGSADTGGAVRVEGGASMLLENSTFSNNSFTADAAAAHARGAAIGYRSDPGITRLILRHVTIMAPAFLPAGIVGTALGGYGGESELTLSVQNSIVRGDCGLEAGAMDANSGNVESGGDTCDFGSSNLVNVSSADLALGSLADHGGPTLTYEPGPDSVAIGAADPDLCELRDQRGFQRPYPDIQAGCDAGSVERGAEERIYADGFE